MIFRYKVCWNVMTSKFLLHLMKTVCSKKRFSSISAQHLRILLSCLMLDLVPKMNWAWCPFSVPPLYHVSLRAQCREPAWGTPPMARSWGRRLGICKGEIEPQESPWKFSSIYPQNQSLPTLLLCALTYTTDFTGGCPGRDKSVLVHNRERHEMF